MTKKTLLRRCYFLAVFFLIFSCTAAQTLNYVHYDEKEGLAGNTVYSMCQDKDGFLWFATDNGISVFDGNKFRNLTVKDGLYDNEVLKVFADSAGRVWILTFSKSIAYWFNDKLHNMENDSLLAKMKFHRNLNTISQSQEGDIMLCDQSELIELTHDNKIFRISDEPFFKGAELVGSFANPFDGGFFVITKDEVYKYKDHVATPSYPLPKNISSTYLETRLFSDGHRSVATAPAAVITTRNKKNNVIFIGTQNGAWELDSVTHAFTTHFLEGKKVSAIFEDSEKNTWFTTLGSGIYKLTSKDIETFSLPGKSNNYPETFSLTANKDYVFGGCSFGKILVLAKKRRAGKPYIPEEYRLTNIEYPDNRVYSAISVPGGEIFGLDYSLVRYNKSTLTAKKIYPIKSLCMEDSAHLLAGTFRYLFRINTKDLSIIDTLWNGRCTAVFYEDSNYYVGTLNGLYRVHRDKTYSFLGEKNYVLSRRINDIKAAADGTLWVATNDNGIAAYKNNSVIKIWDEKNGLSSNICKTLFIRNDILWVGTTKGINRINLRKPDDRIINYSEADGLPSDLINSIYVEDSVIWAGSPAGITEIRTDKISGFSICRLKLFNVISSGKEQSIKQPIVLPYTDNNILFSFTAVSFKSGRDMTFCYRLKGLSDQWNTTRENEISYRSLSEGSYEFELYALNKFGVKSSVINIAFSVKVPFWKSARFYMALILIAALIFFILVNRKNKKAITEIKKKAALEQQFLSLEQQALQARMNPHFIFNCLSSIQQYILTDNKETANKYLTDFAMLVRKTLDYSEKKTIRISEETEYLEKYLEMEQMRFSGSFEYWIIIDPAIDPDYIEIPTLLIQPYVENAIRHGIRNLDEQRNGIIEIAFEKTNNMLFCSVYDNGIGRKKSAEIKENTRNSHHESKGVFLTEKRIMLLNLMNATNITADTVDLFDSDMQSAGTKVLIKIPIII